MVNATFLKSVCLALALGVSALCQPQAASAQAIAVFVNGEPVTTFDIEQRMRMAQRLDRKPMSRQQALDESINDRIKTQEARRIGYRISDDDVNQQFAKFAQGVRQTVPQFEQSLRQSGIEPTALKARTRADIAWATIIQQRLRRGAAITNSEVDQAAQEKSQKTGAKTTEYSIQQVVFVVPAGSGIGVVQRRQKEAAAAKGLFKGCDTGGFSAFRNIPDIAIKDPINRSSDSLTEAANAMLSKTPVGGLAGPLTTEQGVELIAVCNRVERTDISNVRTSVENELFTRKSTAESERLLKELRSKAAIERRGG
ncbi:MAG: SurA N-terminal domain-containing protein [Beijerinckiaceae bacterium]|nr:SurA N-terminal domain-containing protein [Beijerinckiaceae bacterium]